MFKVTKKSKTPNIIWDTDNNRPLCKFVKRIFKTNNEVLAGKLKDMGYAVEGETDVKTFDKMNLDELKDYAVKHNIDLGDAAKKGDVLKVIQKTESKK